MAKQISKIKEPPTTSDPQNFDARADEFVACLPRFVTEANELAVEAEGNANAAQNSKEAAAASAEQAGQARDAAALSAQNLATAVNDAIECKQSAAKSANNAKKSETAVSEIKDGLADALDTLEAMKKISKDGFIDDTQTRTNLTYSSKKIDSDFSKADHNHDTAYLSIEKFNEFKTKIVKKQNNLDFMVNFLQDVTADGVAVKIDDTSNSVYSFVEGSDLVLHVDNGKYFYIGAMGSGRTIISDEIKNPNRKNILKRHQDLAPYPGAEVLFLYKIGDLLYFSRSSRFYVYNTKTEEWVETNSSMGDSLDKMERMHFIDPKFAVTRHSSGLKIKGTNGGNYINLDYGSSTVVIMQDYLIEINDPSKTVKAYKIVVEGDNASKRPIDISQVPYHDSYISLAAIGSHYYDKGTKYYKKDDDLYYLETFEDGSVRGYALYKNKERLPIPIMPQSNEKLFLAQRTRFLINVYIGADQTYTRMYDITGKGKIVRLPVGVLCAEETERGVRIAYVPRLPANGKPRTFYEAILPYEIFSNEE
nr:hypothetical protein [uncultured Campylobacter sp.]